MMSLEDINIKLQLTAIKLLHASPLIEFHNYMSTNTGKGKTNNGWRDAGIINALKLDTKTTTDNRPF